MVPRAPATAGSAGGGPAAAGSGAGSRSRAGSGTGAGEADALRGDPGGATRVSKLAVGTVSSQPRLTVPTRSTGAHIRNTGNMNPGTVPSAPIHMTAPPACRPATGSGDPGGRV